MKIILTLDDNTNIEMDMYSYDTFEICNAILKNKDIKHKRITKIKAKEVFVKNPSFNENEPRTSSGPYPTRDSVKSKEVTVEDLEEILENYKSFINTKVSISNVTKYTFDVDIEGNIFEIIGMFKSLRLNEEFLRYRHYLNNDIALIDYLLRGMDSGRIDTRNSLILRFVSERNCNLNYSQIFDILRRDIAKKDLTDYISIIFYKVHNIKIDEAKVIEEKMDKLSLKAVLNSKIQELDDEIARRLDVTPRANASTSRRTRARVIHEDNTTTTTNIIMPWEMEVHENV